MNRPQELQQKLADSAARSDIECYCTPTEQNDLGPWYIIKPIKDEYADLVAEAFEYLSYRGLIRRHPEHGDWYCVNVDHIGDAAEMVSQDHIEQSRGMINEYGLLADLNIAIGRPDALEAIAVILQRYELDCRRDNGDEETLSDHERNVLCALSVAELREAVRRHEQREALEPVESTFQSRVFPWLLECFGEIIAADAIERNHRFFEEATELVQSCGMTQSEAHQLVDYVYSRPVGDKPQEVGGVMVTLAALCLAQKLDMHQAGEIELARIWTKIETIRAKQATKPKHSPLPQAIAAQQTNATEAA